MPSSKPAGATSPSSARLTRISSLSRGGIPARSEHAGLHVLTADAAIKLFLSDMQYPLLQAARAHLETALRIEPENTDALAVKAALRSWELEQPGDMPTVTES